MLLRVCLSQCMNRFAIYNKVAYIRSISCNLYVSNKFAIQCKFTKMTEWKRPESIPFPYTYSQFEGKQKNGKKRAYWVQDVTEDYVDDVIHHYTNQFWNDEPMNKALGSKDDPLCKEEMTMVLKETLDLKISLICLTKDENDSIKVAGFNVCYVHEKHDEELPIKNDKIKKIVAINDYFANRRNIYEEFNCDSYLSAMGLFVLPEYRREGLAKEILSARLVLGKLMGFKVTLTLFSTPASQIPAEQAGFKDFVTLSFVDIGKIDKSLEMPGIEKYTKIGKLMYKIC